MATKRSAKKTASKKKADLDGLLAEMVARFDALEGKLDALASKTAVLSRMISTERDPGFKTHATVNKRFTIPDDRPRERKMYKAVCAECGVQCEVPFMPRPGRAVYCKKCFSSRKNGANPGANIPKREEIVSEIAKTFKLDIPEPSEKAPPKKAKKARSKTPKTKKTTAKPAKTSAKKAKPKASKAKKPKAKKAKAKK